MAIASHPSRATCISVILSIAFCLVAMESELKAGEPPESPNKKLLDSLLVSRESYRHDNTLQAVIDLGPDAVPEIRPYLHGIGYDRALYVLSQIPEVARESIIDSLRSPHDGLRLAALELAEPFLAAGDREVIDHWTGAFCSVVGYAYELPSRFALVSRLDEETRADVTAKIVECVAGNLPKYSLNHMYVMVRFLGQVADPGDEAVITAIRKAAGPGNARFTGGLDALLKDRSPDDNRPLEVIAVDALHMNRVAEACREALANLGDVEALAAFILDMRSEPAEVRLRRIRSLPKMRPHSELLHASLEILSDQSVIGEQGGGAAPRQPLRACDAMVKVLSQWFTDFPLPRRFITKCTNEELGEAKIWLAQKMLGLDGDERGKDKNVKN
jgi:hypothetical protein